MDHPRSHVARAFQEIPRALTRMMKGFAWIVMGAAYLISRLIFGEDADA